MIQYSNIMGKQNDDHLISLHVIVFCYLACIDVELDMILVKKIVEIVYKITHSPAVEFLQKVYDIVKDLTIFKTARDKLITLGQEIAINYLWLHCQELIEFCQQHKNKITPLTTLPTRVITKRTAAKVGVKAVVRCGAKGSSRGVKTLRTVGNPATLAVDVVQTGLELTGHRKAGVAVGFLGNTGVGAVTGFMVGGPVGAIVGGATCLASWAVGEMVGAAVDKTLS